MRLTALLVALGLVVACSSTGGGDGGGASLQSSCVRDQLGVPRALADGEACKNVGYSDCGQGFASECLGSCAFDVCQSQACASNADCPGFCKEYVVSSVSYGKWCDGKVCPRGTLDCPCDEGACTKPDPAYVVSCNASGVCEGTDTCAAGCRVRNADGASICCGGGFCSGGCVGTPCCR
jgi:hypothetical protein